MELYQTGPKSTHLIIALVGFVASLRNLSFILFLKTKTLDIMFHFEEDCKALPSISMPTTT
jgi:hypothetical protein